MRDNPQAASTEACPMCDESVSVGRGISMAHVCRGCGNVWQPLQILTAAKTCIWERWKKEG